MNGEIKWHSLAKEQPPENGKYLFWLDGVEYGFPVIGRYENNNIWWWSIRGRVYLDKGEYGETLWTEIPKPKGS